MNNNKYYEKTKVIIDKLLIDKDFKQALKIVNEELSMPYIPMEFEDYLLKKLEEIPMNKNLESFSLSLEKIIDLLIKLDKSQSDLTELISHLKKFNLKNEKDELEYYFHKSENKRNRAMIFELLIEEKADIECDLGNPSKGSSIKNDINYKEDLFKLNEKLIEYPILNEPAINLLNEIYLTKHYNQKIEGNYFDMVIFTLAKLFEQKELLNLVDDYEKLKEKLENFTNFSEI